MGYQDYVPVLFFFYNQSFHLQSYLFTGFFVLSGFIFTGNIFSRRFPNFIKFKGISKTWNLLFSRFFRTCGNPVIVDRACTHTYNSLLNLSPGHTQDTWSRSYIEMFRSQSFIDGEHITGQTQIMLAVKYLEFTTLK